MQYYTTLKAKLIYVFSINDARHRGLVKIGDATLDEATSIFLPPNCTELKAAARRRIDQYTRTASIPYTLHHAELTLYIQGGQPVSFNDGEVHDVLIRSGIQRHDFSIDNQGREWFECSPETALRAIQAVKEGRKYLGPKEIIPVEDRIVFRDEQLDAINLTVRKFSSGGKNMLWNAKMRFGKTITALQVVKEMGFKRTIIITHRPVVDDSWFTDFGKLFTVLDGYTYGSRDRGEMFSNLEKRAKKDADYKYIYFASIQDLRGAKEAGGKFEKNTQIFNTEFDLVIIDEAHEGTRTDLGKNVIALLNKANTHVLNLSGTPFNLLDDYQEDEIFTWDYVMEQKAKAEWDLNHFGDPNPYAGLPQLNIFTFDLGKVLDGFEDIEDRAFNFTEFFRVWTGDKKRDFADMPEGMEGRFVHEEHVKAFLDLIVKYDENSNYPFSTVEFRKAFRHSLWMIPGVKEAKALSALLKDHPIFGQFSIVNVAGDGDEDVPDDDALKLVRKAMGENPEETMTITLSCGKLTTGVTVPPWTAVMYLSGSHNTDAKAYMQTIFRVQSPYTTKDGHRKENCYVFDFAPDRTLHVLAKAAKVSQRARSTATEHERIQLGQFLNFCPVIGYNGTKMDKFDVNKMLEELKKAYISRVTKNGCDDPRLYNSEMLRKLDPEALAKFDKLHKIIGSTKANKVTSDKIDMAQNGLTDEEYEQVQKAEKAKREKKPLTEEQKRLLEEAKKKKENAYTAMSILRGISIRMPLLMYGAELQNENEDVTLENFVDLIDDQSWEEFMPRGVTKELFREFIPYYDPDTFRAVSRNYRDLVKQADAMPPMERVKAISAIFDYFRNPDKETVLTPWRVVNMHIGDCIGGWDFYEDDTTTKRVKPKFNDLGEVTKTVFQDPNTRILEINSKTGLYPLYMAYSVFAEKLQAYRDTHMLATDVPLEKQNEIWDEVLRDNIFVICKTEMAKSITKRTLRGFRKAKVNARYFEDLVNKITNQPELFLMKVHNGVNYWNNKELENHMKFSAVVGNPPYMLMDGGAGASATPIYNLFVNIARRVTTGYVSMIMPSRWYSGGKGLDDFRDSMLSDKHICRLDDFLYPGSVFPNTNIRGGLCYFLWDSDYDNLNRMTRVVTHGQSSVISDRFRHLKTEGVVTFIRGYESLSIIEKVKNGQFDSMAKYVSPRKPFGLPTDFTRDEQFKSSPDVLSSPVGCYGKGMVKGYVERNLVKVHTEWIDRWKVLIPSANNIGTELNDDNLNVFLCAPGEITTESYFVVGADLRLDKRMCQNIQTYFSTKFVRFLHSLAKSSQHVTSKTFCFVPLQDFSKPWTDAELYQKYHLTQEEIDYIESMIKPMGDDALFDPDSLINPEFANFDLLEHGVKVGDTIVYTPTGMELVVAENNKVTVDGETFTLAEFTAKYMPRNKRSVSGVCQGPKYFTYKGTSLYKMKESFLGGNVKTNNKR